MKRKHFFGFLGFAATGAGILTGSLLLIQKVIARAVFTSNVTLAIATITLLLAGTQIISVGLASEMLSRTHYESHNKASSDRIHADNGSRFENYANPSSLAVQSRPERPVLMVSAHEPRLVRKIASDRLA